MVGMTKAVTAACLGAAIATFLVIVYNVVSDLR